MDLDPIRLVEAVQRELTIREKDGRPAKVVVATRSYPTNRADLWDALTNPERIPRWFLPISGNLEVGGRYQLEGNAGGEILVCDEPERLGVTWEMHGDPSWLTVELTAEDDERTLLRLEHVAHVPDDFWDQFGPGAVGVGWDQAMIGLERHIFSGGARVDPQEFAAWISGEGSAFLEGSSEAWGKASIAAGTDPEAARAAAARTTAFYRGMAPDDGGTEG